MEDLGCSFGVEIIEEARDVEQQECSCAVRCSSGLDPMDECRDSIDSVVVWL
jgi:hypothetical protein